MDDDKVQDRQSRREPVTRVLLACGIASSLYYAALNVFIPWLWDGYSVSSQTISELSAIGAPTRPAWLALVWVYIVLFAAFGVGVWRSASGNRLLSVLGVVILVYCAVNLYWPPMHLRGNEPTLTDALHIAWSGMATSLFLLIMGLGAACLGRRFRNYTIATIVVLLVFGGLTAREAPAIVANLPTPWIGIWERILIGAFLVWVAVLAIVLLRRQRSAASR